MMASKKQMTQKEKYQMLKSCLSVGSFTAGEFPSFSAFKKALSEGRVAGDYSRKVVIVSNNPHGQYTFIRS